MLNHLINSTVFRKWPVDLLRIVDEYGTPFTFYVIDTSAEQSQQIYEWKDNTLLPLTLVPTPRIRPALARVGRYLYVVFGRSIDSNEDNNLVERFDLHTKQWSMMTAAPHHLHYVAAAVIGTKIYVRGNPIEFGRGLLIYDTISNNWTVGPSAHPIHRDDFVASGSHLFSAGHSGTYSWENNRWRNVASGPNGDCCRLATIGDELLLGFSKRSQLSPLAVYSISTRHWYDTTDRILPPGTLALSYDSFSECLYAIGESAVWSIPCKKNTGWEFGSPSLIFQFPWPVLNRFNLLFV